jgi:hypothetical protein
MKDLTVRLQVRYADGTRETHEWLHVIEIQKNNDLWYFTQDDGTYHTVVAGTIMHMDVFANL